MESLQDKHREATDLHEQMSQTCFKIEVAGKGTKYRIMEKNTAGANGSANKKEEVAMGGSHTTKGSLKCDTTGARVEPPGKEKERAPKTDLEAESSGRTEDSREVLGGCKVYSRGPDQMEGYGRGPMLHKE